MKRRKLAETDLAKEATKKLSYDDSFDIKLLASIDSESEKTCQHMIDFKNNHGRRIYKMVYRTHIKPLNEEDRIYKAVSDFCYEVECQHKTHTQLLICLTCPVKACLDYKHITAHSKETEHCLAMDTKQGNVYCCVCQNYLFDDELSQIARKVNNIACTLKDSSAEYQYTPSRRERIILKAFSEPVKAPYKGLRGIANLGSTCFMNCIVQTLIHTPILRNYFLSDHHVCQFVDKNKCLVCAMATITCEFNNGEMAPYIPENLLHLVWTHARHLAGYEQQDAHEFFISTLDIMHRHCSGNNEISAGKKCNCIVETVFTGSLQSDVVCLVCGGVSSVEDPIWDFSLDLVNASHIEKGVMPSKPQEPLSLYDCLNLFTRTEHLGSSAKIRCNNCQVNQESTKQLSLKKLPNVVSFHLKRFEQTPSRFSKKISTYVSFPLELNMTPFTTASIGARNAKAKARANAMDVDGVEGTAPVEEGNTPPEENKIYTLFAVVNHSGTLETGHYTVFIRHTSTSTSWFKCDDHMVIKTTPEEVLKSEGYLLFYNKKTLCYKR